MAAETIAPDVARRYLLGRQGLWPGRRRAGKEGAARALRDLGSVQLDPLTVVARSHDLVLWGRVGGYRPADLDALLYEDRAFFDYGGHLDVYPIDELPYWRLHMRRRGAQPRQATFAAEHPDLVDQVRAAVRDRGPLGNRDLEGTMRVASYRGRKDTALALYHLWLTGELMTHSRRGFERRYDLLERIAPPALRHEAAEQEAERHFAAKALHQLGLGTARAWARELAYPLQRRLDRDEARRRLDELVAAGEALCVRVEGQREPYYLPAADAPLLADLAARRTPGAWRPLASTTGEEVVLLSPLDNLIWDRARTLALFDFEYVWEIYKPAERRRWGAYTLPILYGDRLVGRLDPKLDRAAGTLRINGFWLEEAATGDDPAFAAALGRGLARLASFLAAREVDLAAVAPAALRDTVRAAFAAAGDGA
ncbi:MAG TPA: crosslink repair DNA glycosylase YcaQ family protein [Thermomicrobiales bacterium]|nr:crosslink repair DNA glycosylase YcaQ family protein [Thermomicrobiales bacterium]